MSCRSKRKLESGQQADMPKVSKSLWQLEYLFTNRAMYGLNQLRRQSVASSFNSKRVESRRGAPAVTIC